LATAACGLKQNTINGVRPIDFRRAAFHSAILSHMRWVLVARAPKDLKALDFPGIALTGAGRRNDANARFRAANRGGLEGRRVRKGGDR
jgi:hypothetical protein